MFEAISLILEDRREDALREVVTIRRSIPSKERASRFGQRIFDREMGGISKRKFSLN
jgi:hypothetical protein